jgi:hypothetical protein
VNLFLVLHVILSDETTTAQRTILDFGSLIYKNGEKTFAVPSISLIGRGRARSDSSVSSLPPEDISSE